MVVLVNRDISSIRVDLSPAENLNFEYVCCDIIGSPTIRLLTIYRAPGKQAVGNEFIVKQLCSYIQQFCKDKYSVAIIGDLNFSNIDWSKMKSNVNCLIESTFINAITELGFHQYIDEPTRGENILDILLCNDPMLLSDVLIQEPFSTSDHESIVFLLNAYDKANSCNYNTVNDNDADLDCIIHGINYNARMYNWHKADWDGLNEFLSSYDWTTCFIKGLSSDKYWNNFYQVLCFACDQFVKLKSRVHAKSYKNHCKVIKYPRAIHKLMHKKTALWRKHRKNKTDINKANYKKLSITCKWQVKNFHRNNENRILASGDLGTFYKYVNSKLSCKSGVGPLSLGGGTFAFDNLAKANLLNDYFASVCVKDNNIMPDCNIIDSNALLTNVKYTSVVVYQILRNQKEVVLWTRQSAPNFI